MSEPSDMEKFTKIVVKAVSDALRIPDELIEEQELRQHGYLPGSYENVCVDCRKEFVGAKRAWRCRDCAKGKGSRHGGR